MRIIPGIIIAALSLVSMTSCAQTESKSGTDADIGFIPDTTTLEKGKKYNPSDSVKNYNGESNALFVFVGEMITVKQLPSQFGDFNETFKARYSILQKLEGVFAEDTIEFLVFDHYGRPPFSKYKKVLLFVYADSGTYVHEKYMYNPVYQTKDGRWAGPYAIQDYGHDFNKNTLVKPVKLEFPEEASIHANDSLTDADWQHRFPEPYFRRAKGRAIVVYGNYVEELVKLKKDGFLKARSMSN